LNQGTTSELAESLYEKCGLYQGHGFQELAEKLYETAVCIRAMAFKSLPKNSMKRRFVSGHGFSHAASATK